MSKFSKIQNEFNENFEKNMNELKEPFIATTSEIQRLSNLTRNADKILDDIDIQFEKATQLKKIDITFLIFAIGFQVARQLLINKLTERVNDKEGAKRMPGHTDEHSNRHHRYYNPSLNEIITNPVPFDAVFGSKSRNLGVGGGFTHRAKTLGHDPILGWIFGTANIATSTCTINNFPNFFDTYHITSAADSLNRIKDSFGNKASIDKVFSYTKNKLLDEGVEGKEKIGASIIKEAIHLGSDVFTTVSLPVPLIPTISVPFARTLADYGIDTGNIIKWSGQAVSASIINYFTAMIHGLFYDKSLDGSWSLYQIRTQKILTYANTIASTSNVILTAIRLNTGDVSAINNLDVGGIIVTINQIVTSKKMVTEIKKEFLKNQWYQIIMGE